MPQLEDVGRGPGGEVLRNFLAVGHNDDGSTIGGTNLVRFASGNYYTAFGMVAQANGQALSANQALFVPFFVPVATTFDTIGLRVTTLGATSTIRLGIYNDANSVPGSLLVDAGTIDSSTTGFKEITISQSLPPNLYWLVAVSQGGTPASVAASQLIWGIMPTLSTGGSSGWSQTGVSGALPATATPSISGWTNSMPTVTMKAH